MSFFSDLKQIVDQIDSGKNTILLYGKNLDNFLRFCYEYESRQLEIQKEIAQTNPVEFQERKELLERLLKVYFSNVGRLHEAIPIKSNFYKLGNLISASEMASRTIDIELSKILRTQQDAKRYETWIDNNKKPASINSGTEKKMVVMRVFHQARRFSLLGLDTSGHMTLEVIDSTKTPERQYLSFVVPVEENPFKQLFSNLSEKSFKEKLTHFIKAPSPKEMSGAFIDLEKDLYQHSKGYYTHVDTVAIDGLASPVLDVSAMYDRIAEMRKEKDPKYNFYTNNCSTVTAEVLKAGNKNNSFRLPNIITSVNLLNNFKKLASWVEKYKFVKNPIQKASKADLLSLVNREIICLSDPAFMDYYCSIENKTVKLPDRGNLFFINQKSTSENLVKNLQVVILGLSQKTDLNDENIEEMVSSAVNATLNFKSDNNTQTVLKAVSRISETVLNKKITEKILIGKSDALKFRLSEGMEPELSQISDDQSLKYAQIVFKLINAALVYDANPELSLDEKLSAQIKHTEGAIDLLGKLSKAKLPNNAKGFSPKFYTIGKEILSEHLASLREAAQIKPAQKTTKLPAVIQKVVSFLYKPLSHAEKKTHSRTETGSDNIPKPRSGFHP